MFEKITSYTHLSSNFIVWNLRSKQKENTKKKKKEIKTRILSVYSFLPFANTLVNLIHRKKKMFSTLHGIEKWNLKVWVVAQGHTHKHIKDCQIQD